MVEVAAANSDSTGAPTGPLHKTAPLSTDSMTFYMFATGKCAAPENKDAVITGSTQVPDFFDVSDGQFVFRKPAPMASVQIPAGYGSTYLTITLQGVTNNDFSNIKNYAALGVREKTAAEGTYSAILNMSSKTSECFHMDENNILELVPLISSTDMSSGEYTAVAEGTPITACPALSAYADKSFDFGSLFKVSTECSETKPISNTAWEELKWKPDDWNCGGSLPAFINNFIYVNGVFFFACNDTSSFYFYINKNYDKWVDVPDTPGLWDGTLIGGIFYSQNSQKYLCVNWDRKGYTSDGGDNWTAEPKLDISDNYRRQIRSRVSIDQKFIIMNTVGHMWSLIDGGQSWSGPVEPHANLTELSEKYTGADWETGDIRYLSYGNGVLVAATANGWTSVGQVDASGNITDWSAPESALQSALNNKDVHGLTFGEGKFLAVDESGNLVSSTNGHKWDSAGTIGSNGIGGLVHDGNAFYAIKAGYSGGNVYRSPSAIDLIKH